MELGSRRVLLQQRLWVLLALLLASTAVAHSAQVSQVHPIIINTTMAADWADDDPLASCTNSQHVHASLDPLALPRHQAATVVIRLALQAEQLPDAQLTSVAGLHLMLRTGAGHTSLQTLGSLKEGGPAGM
jgi:hypothetical protein